MKRNIAVLGLIIVVIAALLWAGIHNGRQRKLAIEQQQQQQQAVLVAQSKTTAAQQAEEDTMPDYRGKPAPGFTLTALDGKKISLADYKGKAVLVNFWATWCAPCKIEMPWLVEFDKKYSVQGLETVGIVGDVAPKDEIEKITQKLGVNYPVLLADRKVGSAYGVDGYPASFFIGRDGKVVEQISGLDTDNGKDVIEADIKKALASGGQ